MALANNRVHALLLPVNDRFLLVPSALVAEIGMVHDLTPVPLSPPWMLGVLNWRFRPVPVCDLARFWGPPVTPNQKSRAIVFYPLPGRKPTEFFALVTSAEPQPRTIDTPAVLLTDEDAVHPYLAVSLDIDSRRAGILDLEALKGLFYDDAAQPA
ncbi:MAG TPA: chemotaxis protein CheW [Acidiferrobacter sp.]|nr:chemotaxis protein CheW [Acidiferrobacter sp.]